MTGGKVVIAAIGALLAVVLQLVIAPNIAPFGVMPSFLITYTLAVALLLEPVPAYVIAFALGMMGDLCGAGPVGALPFILLLAVFLIQQAHKAFGNGTFFVSCLILLCFVIATHLLHAAFMVAMTSTYTALEALKVVALPQSAYDCLLALAQYPLLRRVLSDPPAQQLGFLTPGPRVG